MANATLRFRQLSFFYLWSFITTVVPLVVYQEGVPVPEPEPVTPSTASAGTQSAGMG